MALTPLYINKDLSARELSRLLNDSGLTKSDCELLRSLSHKTQLPVSDSLSASSSVVGSSLVLGGNDSAKGEASACERGEVALSGGEASLPCLRINNSITGACEDTKAVSSCNNSPIPSWVRKSEFIVKSNIHAMVEKFGINCIGFLTLTFADDVQCHKEATKRFNSLATNVLNERYLQWVRVSERQKLGRWHFHLVVVSKQDIRRGVDFDAIKNRRYKDGANTALRNEWAFWRSTSKKYGFGRTEILPVKKTGEALAAYVAKYISKGFAFRQSRDKGARLVSYSQGARVCGSRFAFYSPLATAWRQKVAMWAASYDGVFARVAVSGGHQLVDSLTYEDLPKFFGSKWAWRYRDEIMAMEYPF